MTPPCVVPTFRPYTVENLEFGGFYASSCESRANDRLWHPSDVAVADNLSFWTGTSRLGVTPSALSHTMRQIEERR